MKIAIITVTERANDLAKHILEDLKDDPTVVKTKIYHKEVKKNIKDIFRTYDCIIAIMATGIIIRNICTLIKNKADDPAVLVVDENGKYVISLLSGHLGGGNELSKKIANIITAEPIITTATDLNQKFGIDSLARKYYLKINEVSMIKMINSALLNNKRVFLTFNPKYEFIWKDNNVNRSYEKISRPSKTLTVFVDSFTTNLEPKKIVVGIGSKRNIKSSNIIKAIKSAIEKLNIPIERIDSIATGEMKRNEEGIVRAASELNIPLEIIPKELLMNFQHSDIQVSDFVLEKFGVPGVSEPSALIASGEGSSLIFRKTAYNGITIALAVSK